MANALYPTSFKEGLLAKEFDMDTDIIKASLIDTGDYTYGAAHTLYGSATPDVPDVSKVAVSAQLTSPTIADGVFDTADFSWVTVTGDQSEAIILWDDTLTDDRLIAYYDTGLTGMPVTPNGGDINVTVHTSGWFSL